MNQKRALFAGLDAGPKISELSLADVRPDPEQPRKTFDPEPLKELASSIEQHGQIAPIVVRKDPNKAGKFLITAGERRYRAIQLNKGKTILAIVRDEQNAPVISIIENLQRVDLSPVEEAAAVARLIDDQKLNQNSASKLLGKKRVLINQLLSVNKLPPAIRAEATEVGVSKSILIELAQITDKSLLTKPPLLPTVSLPSSQPEGCTSRTPHTPASSPVNS